MAADVGQRLLDDPVRREVEPCGKCPVAALDREVDLEARSASSVHELGERLQPWLRREIGLRLRLPEHADQPAHLREGR